MSVTPYLKLADAKKAIDFSDRFAELTDPFGHRWMLSAPKA